MCPQAIKPDSYKTLFQWPRCISPTFWHAIRVKDAQLGQDEELLFTWVSTQRACNNGQQSLCYRLHSSFGSCKGRCKHDKHFACLHLMFTLRSSRACFEQTVMCFRCHLQKQSISQYTYRLYTLANNEQSKSFHIVFFVVNCGVRE